MYDTDKYIYIYTYLDEYKLTYDWGAPSCTIRLETDMIDLCQGIPSNIEDILRIMDCHNQLGISIQQTVWNDIPGPSSWSLACWGELETPCQVDELSMSRFQYVPMAIFTIPLCIFFSRPIHFPHVLMIFYAFPIVLWISQPRLISPRGASWWPSVLRGPSCWAIDPLVSSGKDGGFMGFHGDYPLVI